MKDRNILLLNNFFSFPLWQHLSWDFQTLMRQSLIYFDTFKTHPALASPIIFSFLPCSVGLVLLFMRPSITSSFSFFNACQVLYLWHVCGEGVSPVCIWFLDGRCSNLYGPDASLTASPTSSQHPCEQGRLALICVAYWRLPTRCQRPQGLHNQPPLPSVTVTPASQTLPAQVGHLAAQLSGVTCAHALRHLPSP